MLFHYIFDLFILASFTKIKWVNWEVGLLLSWTLLTDIFFALIWWWKTKKSNLNLFSLCIFYHYHVLKKITIPTNWYVKKKQLAGIIKPLETLWKRMFLRHMAQKEFNQPKILKAYSQHWIAETMNCYHFGDKKYFFNY